MDDDNCSTSGSGAYCCTAEYVTRTIVEGWELPPELAASLNGLRTTVSQGVGALAQVAGIAVASNICWLLEGSVLNRGEAHTLRQVLIEQCLDVTNGAYPLSTQLFQQQQELPFSLEPRVPTSVPSFVSAGTTAS